MIAFSIRRARRSVQLGTALAFILIPWLNSREIDFFTGNMLAFSAGGLPLADPLAMLQAAVASHSATIAMTVGAALSLLLAAVLGPVFCSWLCPFGFLSELVQPLLKKGEQRSPNGKLTRFLTRFQSSPALNVSLQPFVLKAAIACCGILLIPAALPLPMLTQLSMPGWYTRFWQQAILHKNTLWPAALAIPGLLALEAFAGRRFWCRFLCPQSVLLCLAAQVLPQRLRVRLAKQSCACAAADRPCGQACTLGLNPRDASLTQNMQCSNCGDCIEACAKRGGALSFAFCGQRP